MSDKHDYSERLLELLAAQQLGDLSHDEQEELSQLAASAQDLPDDILGELLIMLDQNDPNQEGMPERLASSITMSGKAAIAAQASGPISLSGNQSTSQSPSSINKSWLWITSAAAVIAIGASIFAVANYSARSQAQIEFDQQLASLQSKINNNQSLLDASRIASAKAQKSIDSLEQANQLQASQLAQAENARLELATQLAQATSSLDNALDQIAIYETPLDPTQLAESRRQLLTVPDTVEIAWQPFDLPDDPAEQQQVRGDVVWSDSLQEGYIRFVGLEPNDPDVEQYQIWVIDERGLEQKVSGGVFNATAEGEIIVPITPGIDVGRVGLFAITVENPGGTWVPDLSRRVVVAPRDG